VALRVFEYSSEFSVSPERLWAFHERPDVIQLLTPPLTPLKVVRQSGGLEVGAEKEFLVGGHRWLARHVACEPGRMFVDEQIAGPFRYWQHIHVVAWSAKGSRLTDRVTYDFFGGALLDPLIRWQLRRLFRHRHGVTGRLA
jgi:ligand-binding SRPBCC domain-containing protein